jgi:acetyltransferase
MIDYAAARGIGEIVGDVLQANARMLDLARHLGFRIEQTDQDAKIVRVSLRLDRQN